MDKLRSEGLNALELTNPRDFLNSKPGESVVKGLQVIDLGDAREETKQVSQFPRYADSVFGVGWAPD